MMNLTARERQVLSMFTLSNQEISDKLCISLSTTKHHIHNIISKFYPSENRCQIVLQAVKEGVIGLEEIIL